MYVLFSVAVLTAKGPYFICWEENGVLSATDVSIASQMHAASNPKR